MYPTATNLHLGPLFTLKESAMWRKVLSPFPTPAWVAHGWLMGGSPKKVGFPHGHQGPISASAPLSSLLTGLCLHLVPYFLISAICLFTNLFNTNNTYQHVSQCFKGAMEISSLNQNTLRWKLSSLFCFFYKMKKINTEKFITSLRSHSFHMAIMGLWPPSTSG